MVTAVHLETWVHTFYDDGDVCVCACACACVRMCACSCPCLFVVQMSGGCGDAKVGGVFNPFNKMGSDMMKPERSPVSTILPQFPAST